MGAICNLLALKMNQPKSLCPRKFHTEGKLLEIEFKLNKIKSNRDKVKKSPVNREGNKVRRFQRVSCCVFDTTLQQQKSELES